MGNFEKLVVLIVLFLSAVALAVSSGKSEETGAGPTTLTTGGEKAVVAQGATNERSTPRPYRRTTAPAQEKTSAPSRSELSPSLLLDATDVTGAATKSRLPAATNVSDGRILKSTSGLKESLVDDFMQYTVRDGDTWVGLAQRFYRDARQATNLRVANDDPSALRAGMAILVPVYDLTKEAGLRDPFVPIANVTGASKTSGTRGRTRRNSGTTPAPKRAANASAPREGAAYVVQDGDNLSKISKSVYGTATRWQEIYEANKDVMKSADWLSVGMELFIPEAGTVPVPKLPASTEAVPVSAGADGTSTAESRVR